MHKQLEVDIFKGFQGLTARLLVDWCRDYFYFEE